MPPRGRPLRCSGRHVSNKISRLLRSRSFGTGGTDGRESWLQRLWRSELSTTKDCLRAVRGQGIWTSQQPGAKETGLSKSLSSGIVQALQSCDMNSEIGGASMKCVESVTTQVVSSVSSEFRCCNDHCRNAQTRTLKMDFGASNITVCRRMSG